MDTRKHAILLAHCTDRPGLVAAVANYILARGGNILGLEQHVDAERNRFFLRAEWDLSQFRVRPDDIAADFHASVGALFALESEVYFRGARPRVALFVSRLSHCLYDLLARQDAGEWEVEIPVIVSNHALLEPVARRFDIAFHFLPFDDGREAAEVRQWELLDAAGVDLIVLARYMQILSPSFVARYPSRIVNIHHSFLPAFPGARPYHSAHERGVKIIGATSHYVTDRLDEGPIIEQDVVRISHRDGVEDLVRKGRDLEKLVLARAVLAHTDRRILVDGNRTVVFER